MTERVEIPMPTRNVSSTPEQDAFELDRLRPSIRTGIEALDRDHTEVRDAGLDAYLDTLAAPPHPDAGAAESVGGR